MGGAIPSGEGGSGEDYEGGGNGREWNNGGWACVGKLLDFEVME